ncbi:MAG TPA: ATP-binding protein [Candidatus Paceibacterota bacterium]
MKNKKLQLFVTMGIPGSGKSYFAERFCKEYGLVHLRSDEIRKLIFAKPTFSREENLGLFSLIDFFVDTLLLRGVGVVYDSNFSLKKRRVRLLKMAKMRKATFAIFWVKTPIDVAIRRAKSRAFHPISERVVKLMDSEIEVPKGEPVVEIDGTKSYKEQKAVVLKSKFLA